MGFDSPTCTNKYSPIHNTMTDNLGQYTLREVEKLFKKLDRMNIAVQKNYGYDFVHGDRPALWIWTEGITEETETHIDYYANHGCPSEELTQVLYEAESFAEWDNSAVCCIYKV